MTFVNSQITDSVVDSGVMIVGDAPAAAMRSVYKATAHALGLAAVNAVAAQQQTFISAQATAVQGVARMYSLNAAATPDQIDRQVADAAGAVQAAAVPPTPPPAVSVRDAGQDAVEVADEVAYGMRATMDAFAAGLEASSEAVYENLLHVIQIAATSACLTAMIAEPEKASSYESVLAAIKRLA